MCKICNSNLLILRRIGTYSERLANKNINIGKDEFEISEY